jgi:hypothetical protein
MYECGVWAVFINYLILPCNNIPCDLYRNMQSDISNEIWLGNGYGVKVTLA